MISIKKATTIEELKGILVLQKSNLKESLESEEIDQEGFVTLNHDLGTLSLMNSYEKQIIATNNGSVIGYALVMVKDLKNHIPVLMPMFDMLETIEYKSKIISESKYYIMGQVCIDKDYRGKGIFAKLYEKHKLEMASKYDYCITEVSNSNKRSMRAHEKVGFENIHSFSDATDTWKILLLNLNL